MPSLFATLLGPKIALPAFLSLLAALAVCWFGWEAAAAKRDSLKADLSAAQTQIDTMRTDARLKEQQAQEARRDADTRRTQTEELEDARSNPDNPRLRALCVKLRQQSEARFNATPACQRFAG